MKTNKFLGLFITVILLFSVTGKASAKGNSPDWSDLSTIESMSGKLANASPEEQIKIWNQLPPEAKAAIIKFNTITMVVETMIPDINSNMTVLSTDCMYRYGERRGYNGLGVTLYIYWSNVEWCYNGATVTSKFWTHGAQIPFPSMWRWIRDAAISESGGVGSTSYRVWTEADMEFNVAGYPIQTAFPWVDITVRGNGTSSVSVGG